MDYFIVPTLTFDILYCFFIISHDRRRIVYHNVTHNPKPQRLKPSLARRQLIRATHDC